MGIAAVAYMCVGVFGYLAFPSNVASNILLNFAPDDQVMQVGGREDGRAAVSALPSGLPCSWLPALSPSLSLSLPILSCLHAPTLAVVPGSQEKAGTCFLLLSMPSSRTVLITAAAPAPPRSPQLARLVVGVIQIARWVRQQRWNPKNMKKRGGLAALRWLCKAEGVGRPPCLTHAIPRLSR